MPGEDQSGESAPFRFGTVHRPEDVEDCVACRFIWLQVEQEAGAAAGDDAIYKSFSNSCKSASEAPIFYSACQDMMAQADDMIGDYMDGYTVNQLCENSRLCR